MSWVKPRMSDRDMAWAGGPYHVISLSVPRNTLPVLPSKVSVTPLTPRLRKEGAAWEEVVCSSGKRMKFGARHTWVQSRAPSLTSYVFGKVTPLHLVCKCRLHSGPRELLWWLTTAYGELSAQRLPCLRGQQIGDFHIRLHKERRLHGTSPETVEPRRDFVWLFQMGNPVSKQFIGFL